MCACMRVMRVLARRHDPVDGNRHEKKLSLLRAQSNWYPFPTACIMMISEICSIYPSACTPRCTRLRKGSTQHCARSCWCACCFLCVLSTCLLCACAFAYCLDIFCRFCIEIEKCDAAHCLGWSNGNGVHKTLYMITLWAVERDIWPTVARWCETGFQRGVRSNGNCNIILVISQQKSFILSIPARE